MISNKRNILISGASSGIGRELALNLSNDSENHIIAFARNAELLEDLNKASNNKVTIIVHDISKEKASALYTKLQAKKIEHIDILIHNAGYLSNTTFDKMPEEELRQCYEVNVLGPYLITQQLLPMIRKSERERHIVHISSMGGVQGTAKFAGLSAYSSSKGALTILTECLAEELKEENIKVNCLALGAVDTMMLKTAFPNFTASMTAEEIAKHIAYFSIEGVKYYNGKTLPVSSTTP